MTIQWLLFVLYFVFMIFAIPFILQFKSMHDAKQYEILIGVFLYPVVLLITFGMYFGKIVSEKIEK